MPQFVFCKKDEFMRILKKKILSYLAGVLVFFGYMSTEVEGMTKAYANSESQFDLSQSLSKWPILNLLETQKEKDIYESIWDPNSSLKQNQERLFDLFLKTCCDFSFTTKETEVPGVFVGEGESGTPIVFVDSDIETSGDFCLDNIWLQNPKEKGKKFRVNLTTTILNEMRPLEFSEKEKHRLKQYLKKLTEDSVGCELLRVAVAKYGARKNKSEKIKFLPVKSNYVDFAYALGASMWQYIGLNQHIDLSVYRKHWKKQEFILFSPDWFRTECKGFLMKLNNNKKETESSKTKKLTVYWDVIPKESNLLNEIIHAIHSGTEKTYKKTTNILKRSNHDYLYVRSKKRDWSKIEEPKFNISIFYDDEVYRTMFGITSKGLDPISEAAYLSHKYKFIRPAFVGDQTKFILDGRELSQKQMCQFFKEYFKSSHIDRDLYKYYLSPKSPIKYPEFGEGNYLYAKINDLEDESIKR